MGEEAVVDCDDFAASFVDRVFGGMSTFDGRFHGRFHGRWRRRGEYDILDSSGRLQRRRGHRQNRLKYEEQLSNQFTLDRFSTRR